MLNHTYTFIPTQNVQVYGRVSHTSPCLRFAVSCSPKGSCSERGDEKGCVSIALRFASELWGWLVLPTGEKLDLSDDEGHICAIQDYAGRVGEVPEDLDTEPFGEDIESWHTWFLKKGGLMIRGFGPVQRRGGEIDIDFHSEGVSPKSAIRRAQEAVWDGLTKRIMDWEVRMVDWRSRDPYSGRDDMIFDTVSEFLNA